MPCPLAEKSPHRLLKRRHLLPKRLQHMQLLLLPKHPLLQLLQQATLPLLLLQLRTQPLPLLQHLPHPQLSNLRSWLVAEEKAGISRLFPL